MQTARGRPARADGAKMTAMPISRNTKAVLLLTAPLLLAVRRAPGAPIKPLTPLREYALLARRLSEIGCEPADLLGVEAASVLDACLESLEPRLERSRIEALLGRGVRLGLVAEHWQARAIWAVSSADRTYPRRLLRRLGVKAPPVLYGCGDGSVLDEGGLAVVGPRNAPATQLDYAAAVGRLAARSGRTIISGGARGVDRAAMTGALGAGGRTIGVLACQLALASTDRSNREPLMDGRLVFVSPHDPRAGFHIGHAMERNHSVYGLADAALVVDALTDGGGTRAGAVAQLADPKRSSACPVYVRSTLGTSEGLAALETLGAIPWPNPKNPDELAEVLEQRGVKAVTTGGREAQVSATEAPSRVETARQQLLLPVGEPS